MSTTTTLKNILTITDIISALILLLFLYTAVSKLADHERFNDVLLSSPLLTNYADSVTWALPVTELIITLLLFIPSTRRPGLYASFILLIILTLYLLWMVLFASHLPCNCGGVISEMSWIQHIAFNGFFIIINLIGIRYSKRTTL